jgi:hypothetical protein
MVNGQDLASHSLADPDTTRVLEILQGAHVAPRDPDLQLATLLAELKDVDDVTATLKALERLVHDAHPD